MTTYETLSEHYDAGRVGYANEIYTTIARFGVAPNPSILDVACGTGLGCAPLIAKNFAVTGVDSSEAMLAFARERYPNATFVHGCAEALPFPAESFDVVTCAQAFHQFDRAAAFAEMLRVLRPNGVIAFWWKSLMHLDPHNVLRRDVFASVGAAEPKSGMQAGFKEFYAAGLQQPTLRVIPWRTVTSLSKFLRSERSRKTVVDALGDRADAYFEQLEARLRATHGAGDPALTLSYTHFLYLGKK